MTALTPRLLLLSGTLLLCSQVLAQPAAEKTAPAAAGQGTTRDATKGEANAEAASTSESETAPVDEPASDLDGYVPPGSESSDLDGYAPAGVEDTDEADAAGAAADAPQGASDDPSGLPPPGPPRADEQQPAPVASEPKVSVSRRLVMSMYFGPVYRSSAEERISYGTSIAWGPSATVLVAPWLRVMGYGRLETIPVDARPGAFDTARTSYPDTTIEQDSLDSVGLGVRAAPSVAINDWLRCMAFVDLAWNRFTAQAPRTTGATEVRSAERAGVGLNYKAGLGVSVEPIGNWMDVSLNASYGFFTSQTGSAFKGVLQGFDQTGYIVHLAPLPRFERSFELLLSAGIIL
jgi:hypothetical protein